MALVPLRSESLRHARDAIASVARGDSQLAARLVGDVLLDQAEQRAATASLALIDARLASLGASEATCTADGIAPIAVLRKGPANEAERALVSVLLAMHIGALVEASTDASTWAENLTRLDWLEFTGPYSPYGAARIVLSGDTLTRFERALREVDPESPSANAAAAARALRGISTAGAETMATIKEALPAGLLAGAEPVPAALSIAGEVEGLHRGAFRRALSIVTGWSVLRGVFVTLGRIAFSFRRPATVSLDGDLLRVMGHTEILGRTLRTFDVRYPLDQLVEIKREVRFPALPVAIALVGLAAGAFFGARAVVEGAGVAYFPLIGLGIGLIFAGLVFDLLLRALFPGLRGLGRIIVRAADARAVVLSHLAIDEADKLLDALDKRFRASPAPRALKAQATAKTATAPDPDSKASGATKKARPAPRP